MKKILFLILIPVIVIIFALSIEKFIYKEFDFVDDQLAVEINGRFYNFTNTSWTFKEINKRIGYFKRDVELPKIFYLPFPHGIYSLKYDNDQMFYQILRIMASKDYPLLVRDDIELLPPVSSDINYIMTDAGIKIDEKNIIEDFMDVVYSIPTIKKVEYPLTIHKFNIYSSKYPSLHYEINVYADKQNVWYVHNPNNANDFSKIPYELQQQLILSNMQ